MNAHSITVVINYLNIDFAILTVNIFITELLNVITYNSGQTVYYFEFEKKIVKATIPWKTYNNKPIISYDIDVLARNVFFTTEEGLFRFCWGIELFYMTDNIKINDKFTTGTKIRFDNIGKILYIQDHSGIYISVYPYREYDQIVSNHKTSNFEIISEIGYS